VADDKDQVTKKKSVLTC